MKTKNYLSIFLAVISWGLLLNSFTPLFCQTVKGPVTPLVVKSLKVKGYITLVDNDGTQWYNNRVYLHDSRNNPVSRIMCKFNSGVMTENSPGTYHIKVRPAAPTSGKLTVTINEPKTRYNNPNYHSVSAYYKLASIVRITGPVTGAHIPLATTPHLAISWSGGTTRGFTVLIYECKGDLRGASVYDQRRITSRRIVISTRIFRPGKKYELDIIHTYGTFTMSGLTRTGSEIQMQQHTTSHFFID